MKIVILASALVALLAPAPALAAGPTPKGVAWQLTAALQKREKLLGEHYGLYGAHCQTQVAGRSWACTVNVRSLDARLLFPDVTYKSGVFEFGSPVSA